MFLDNVFLNSDSRITLRTHFPTSNSENLVLQGDAQVDMGISSGGAHRSRTWTGEISGTGKLGIGTSADQTINLDATNDTFSGGLYIGDNDGAGFGGNLASLGNSRLVARAPFALGIGDVFVGDGVSLRIQSENAMNPNATLTVATNIRLDFDLVVRNATLDGTPLAPGIYNSASGLVDSGGTNLITGTGNLRVVPEPGASMFLGMCTLLFGLKRWLRVRMVRFRRSL